MLAVSPKFYVDDLVVDDLLTYHTAMFTSFTSIRFLL